MGMAIVTIILARNPSMIRFYTINYLLQQINPEDEAAIEKFMSKTETPVRTLNDIILEKIEKKKAELELQSVCPEDDEFMVSSLKKF